MYSSTGMPYAVGDNHSGGQYYGRPEDSPMARMREHYWTAKQAIRTVIGKKEDEHLVASDTELDAKLATYYSLKSTCEGMLRCIEHYQDFICDLSQEESTLGRFLKHHGKQDKTQAGKMMSAVGRAESYTAQQRLALRVPLVRLYQELETFTERAITDTHVTVLACEKARIEYRGSLLWMKKVSSEFDPDSYRQMEKYRKVQAAVKRNKASFDRCKLNCLQKIDLLAASRCNLFSNLMANYQNCLLTFWDRTSKAHTTVSNSFSGYQHYEFTVLKQLREPSRKLAELTSGKKSSKDEEEEGEGDDKKAEAADSDDTLINLDNNNTVDPKLLEAQKAVQQLPHSDSTTDDQMAELLFLDSPEHNANGKADGAGEGGGDLLASLGMPSQNQQTAPKIPPPPGWKPNIGTEELGDFSGLDAVTSLLDSLGGPAANPSGPSGTAGGPDASGGNSELAQRLFDEVLTVENDQSSFTYQWQSAFGTSSGPMTGAASSMSSSQQQPQTSSRSTNVNDTSPIKSSKSFMPSQLLDMAAKMGTTSQPSAQTAKGKDKEAWFSMFADLDPLKSSSMDMMGGNSNDKA